MIYSLSTALLVSLNQVGEMGWAYMGMHELHKDLRYENLVEKVIGRWHGVDR
jgi:hypothetical protein